MVRKRSPVACDPCRKAHQRCSGDGPPCGTCREYPDRTNKCTFGDSSGFPNRSLPSEMLPLLGTIGSSKSIPEEKSCKTPGSTKTAIDGLNETRGTIKQPTINQYILVLSYLFLASRVPYDSEAISRIIARGDKEWEKNFRPQYPRLLSWWIPIRGDLTQQGGILAVSIEDMIQQMRYLLYLIGRLSSPQSGIYSQWESPTHPTRPFGMNASVALVCYCFNGTESVQGYESLDIWSCNEGFLFTMGVQLGLSPTFRDGISLTQLKHMIASLQTALNGEDHRSYLPPWPVRIDDSAATLSYYQRAIKCLNPELLPEILSRWAKVLPEGEILPCVENWDFSDHAMIEGIISFLARVFQRTYHPMILHDAMKEIPQLMDSRPDRDVTIEMMHVREWERLHREGSIGQCNSIRVLVVPP